MMERLLLFLSFFYPITVNSQTYYPFPVDSAIWTVDLMSAQGPFGSTTHFTMGYTMTGDSMVNGNLYSKIYLSDSAGNIEPFGLTALTREVNKVIYCIYLGYNNQQSNEVVLYDFNLVAGDTFSFPSYGFQTIFIVDSVGTIQTFAGNRNAIYLSIVSNPGNAYYINPVWIEGIGDIVNGVIYHEVPWIDWWYEGLCFAHHTTLVWNRYNSICSIGTGINDNISENRIKCHPNPSQDEIVVIMNNGYDEKNIEVFDAAGRKVFQASTSNNEFVLKKHHTGNGIFLLRVSTVSNDIQIEKIVFTN